MSNARFAVTAEIVSFDGETDEPTTETVEEWPAGTATLRNAVETVRETRTSRCGGIESITCDHWPVDRPRCITVQNSGEYETGASESRSLHIPDTVSRSSARRIARLVGAKV